MLDALETAITRHVWDGSWILHFSKHGELLLCRGSGGWGVVFRVVRRGEGWGWGVNIYEPRVAHFTSHCYDLCFIYRPCGLSLLLAVCLFVWLKSTGSEAAPQWAREKRKGQTGRERMKRNDNLKKCMKEVKCERQK